MTGTVLITGSSRGIGRSAVEHFAAKGWKVAATARSIDALRHWAGHSNITAVCLDVTNETSIASALETTRTRFGVIDVLVNNAAYGLMGPLEGITPEQLEAQFRTNFFGAVTLIRSVLPEMRSRRRGVIVNVSSIGGRVGLPFIPAYTATKFALEGLSELMRFELKPHGIRMKIVEPGGIKTDFIANQLWASKHPAYEPWFSEFAEMSKRIGARGKLPGPEFVARTIYKAATDGSDRLRYPSKTGPFLLLNALLPDFLWRSMVGSVISREAGEPA